jgi:hypothetical protein
MGLGPQRYILTTRFLYILLMWDANLTSVLTTREIQWLEVKFRLERVERECLHWKDRKEKKMFKWSSGREWIVKIKSKMYVF